MIQTSNYLLSTMTDTYTHGGMSFLTIAILVFAYFGITSVILKTFQYLKERDINRYK